MRSWLALGFMTIALVGCGDDATDPENLCEAIDLPLIGGGGQPTVVDVALEAQPDGIVVLATVTDPEGSDNLLGVVQEIGVFPDARCEGAPIVVQDDLACSGCEESFGTAVSAATNQALFDAIAAQSTWPVTVDFADLDGNRISGRVLARVIHSP